MKKFISMALALVMTLSLCTFVATPEADAFTDTDELSQYAKQAIDVVQTIDVMSGYEDDTFKPEATLTRQAAAKIICNMILGPVAAKALPATESPFPDVTPNTEWAGYIAYCSHEGIINGYSDNTFKPTGALTGYAFLKMLLGALGYSTQAEGFTGGNWKVNVAKIALGIDLNKGITSDPDGEHLDQGVTREDAAIYSFNTLQADLVEYPSQNSININGVTVSMGNGKASPQTWNTSVTSIDYISASRSDGNNARPIVQFAERYFDKLRREPNGYSEERDPITRQLIPHYGNGRDEYTTDDFGRPSVRWFWKGIEIGTYPRAADATFVGNPKANEIYEALGMTSGNGSAYLYINSNLPNNTTLDISRGNDKALDHARNLNMVRNDALPTNGEAAAPGLDAGLGHRVDRLGNGSLVECFLNTANNHVDVCVISIYGGKVSSVRAATSKKDAYVTIDYASDANHRPDTINVGDHNEYETEEFDEDDVVAYTYSDSADGIKNMYLMNSEDGILQSRIQEKSLRLDDTTYTYGKEYAFNEMTENDLSSKSAYVVYMFQWAPVLGDREILGDDDDYALWIEEDEFAVDQYVLLERITIETTGRNAAGQKVTTKTASVMGTAEVSDSFDGDNDVSNQRAYNQSKAPVGTSSWDAQAQARFSNGSRRTVTLDDSKNYRTSAASDSANYADIQDLINDNGLDADGYAVYADGTRYHASGNNNNGNGDGNWISAEFTAPRIVRLTSTGSGYKLHRVDAKYTFEVGRFSLDNKKVYTGYDTNGDILYDADGNPTRREISIPGSTTRLLIDSETHFVVEDTTNGTYKSYVGSKNVPDVKGFTARAFVYHRGDLAKLIFITNAANVTSSSNDILFLSANSTSNLVDSDDGYYYDVNAVNKNVIETIRVKRGSTLNMNGLTFTPGAAGNKSESRCVILNTMTYDSNDLLIDGSFDTTKVSAARVQGIRRVNEEEIRLNTNAGSYLRDVSQGCKVYFVDGDDIEEIDYDEIVNDTNDYVYYVEDDGVITYLFIVNYEPEASVPTYNVNVTSASRVGAYTIQFTDGSVPASVKSGDKLDFQVKLGNQVKGSDDVEVGIEYTLKNSDGQTRTAWAEENTSISGLWTVTVPESIEADTTIFFVVNEL